MAICDSQLYFARDVKVFIEPLDEAGATQNEIWEIPVLDGFSFSQANNSSEVTISEMENTGGVSRRGKKVFNDSLAPAEWSFSTYTRPFVSTFGTGSGQADATAANVHAVEEVLWALLAGKAVRSGSAWGGTGTAATIAAASPVSGNSWTVESLTVSAGGTGYTDGADLVYTIPGGNWDAVVTYTVVAGIVTVAAITAAGTGYTDAETDVLFPDTDLYFWLDPLRTDIDFKQSNTSTLGTANIYFELQSSGLTYKIGAAAVNEATITFDIDGIAMFEWSGMGSDITDAGEVITADVYESITATDNFIRNRLTQLAIEPVKTGSDTTGAYTIAQEGQLATSYDLTLTGGSITISNNITYITPEELGIVNIAIGHVTGTRSISGTFTNYLVTDSASTDKSADLWDDIRNLTSVVTHSFDLVFKVGGSTQTPRVEFSMGNCHIETPTHGIEDVISLETNFTALGQCINAADELLVSYYAT